MQTFWVAYFQEDDCVPQKLHAYDTRTNYATGKQMLEFQIMINHKKIWVNAEDCIVINKNTQIEL